MVVTRNSDTEKGLIAIGKFKIILKKEQFKHYYLGGRVIALLLFHTLNLKYKKIDLKRYLNLKMP